MDGKDIDREIESLLAVDPSPEFVARVRARVATEPASGRWRASWIFATATAVAAVVVAVTMWPSREVASTKSVPAPVTTSTALGVVPARAPALSAPRQVSTNPRPAMSVPPRVDIQFPDVLVAESERRGFELLIEELSDRNSAPVVAHAASGRDTPGPPWIEVGPVVIEPLRDVGIFQGVEQ